MAVRRRVDKSRYKLDLATWNLWQSGHREALLEVFGDVETAQRFFQANEGKLGLAAGTHEGWWEFFGPEHLRWSHPENPDYGACSTWGGRPIMSGRK